MNTYWADVTVKVKAESQAEANSIIHDAANQMTDIYTGQLTIKGIELDMDADEYAAAMPYDHFNEG